MNQQIHTNRQTKYGIYKCTQRNTNIKYTLHTHTHTHTQTHTMPNTHAMLALVHLGRAGNTKVEDMKDIMNIIKGYPTVLVQVKFASP